jgi:hypothetical protein
MVYVRSMWMIMYQFFMFMLMRMITTGLYYSGEVRMIAMIIIMAVSMLVNYMFMFVLMTMILM